MSNKAAPRHDVAIYAPASAPLYLEDAPAVGGAELQMVMLARSLARLGFTVCHIVARADGLPDHHEGVDLVIEDPAGPGDGACSRLRRTTRALGRADAGVYVQRSAGLVTALAGAFARAHRRGFVYSTSSPLDLTHELPLSWHESVGFRLGLRCAQAVVVQTGEQAVAAPRRLKPIRIPSFCEPAAPAPSERDTFLWVGRPAPYKNPLAFAALARSVPEARFLMVGIDAGSVRESLSSDLVAAATALPNLELVRPLPRSQLLPLYQRAVAVVNTSDFEGFPNTLLEGWARGALALSLTVDPDDVITRHRIGAVAGGSTAEFAIAARRMWRERSLLERERTAAVRYVADHHAPDIVARRWSELLTTLLASRSPAQLAGTAGP